MTTMSRPPTTKAVSAAAALTTLIGRLGDPGMIKKNPLTADDCKFVVECAKKLYKKNPQTLIYVNDPIHLCGDTHGQYRDVVRIFSAHGWPDPTFERNPQGKKFGRYLFLGDYVDRGTRSIETMTLLFGLKVAYNKHIHLLRGNHEASEINGHYGFKTELITRFGQEHGMQLWHDFNETFMWMPLAAVVSCGNNGEGGRMFCMHGGIPAKQMSKDFDELKGLTLPIKSPRENEIVADLLWSDPAEEVNEFVKNPRGLGHQFGPPQAVQFCEKHDIDLICRAHQVFKEGFKYMGSNCLTIFSAPNYGGQFDNAAAILKVGPKATAVDIDLVQPFHAYRR